MATLSERLQFLISADGAQAIATFQKVGEAADKELGKAESKAEKATAQLTKFGAGAVGASLVAAGALGKMAQGASDLAETVSKSRVVFGDASKGVEAFAATAAKAMGQSKKDALDAASTFGVFGKAAGLTGKDLADFSTSLVGLSSDLASFGNSTPEEAVEALGQALRGENEGIRRYGVLLDDATLKQRALSMGLIDTTTGTLPPAIKVQAAYREILAQTSLAQGDFARTSDGAANQQRILRAELKNLSDGIGQGVLPMFTAVVSQAAAMVGKFNELSPATQGLIGSIGAFATAGLGTVGVLSSIVGQAAKLKQRFTDDVTGALTTSGKAAGVLGIAVGVAAGAFVLLQSTAQKSIVTLKDFGTTADEQIVKKLTAVRVSFEEATDAIDKLRSGMTETTNRANDLLVAEADLVKAGTKFAQVQKDFNNTLEKSPAYAQRFIDVAKAAGYETSEWQARLDEHVRLQGEAKVAQDEYNRSIEEATRAAQTSARATGAMGGEQAAFQRILADTTRATAEQAKADEGAAKAADEARKAQEEKAKAIRDAFAAAEESINPALRYRNAQREVRDAAREVAEKLKLATDRKFEDVDANDDVQAAQDELATKLQSVAREYANASGAAEGTTTWAQKYVDKLNELRPQYGEALGPAIAEYDKLKKSLEDLIRSASLFAGMSPTQRGAAGYESIDGMRASGGPVMAQGAYVVGENGPELFVPNANGNVIANGALSSAGAAGGGGPVYNITVNALSPQAAGRAVVEAIAAYERTHGKGWRQ